MPLLAHCELVIADNEAAVEAAKVETEDETELIVFVTVVNEVDVAELSVVKLTALVGVYPSAVVTSLAVTV